MMPVLCHSFVRFVRHYVRLSEPAILQAFLLLSASEDRVLFWDTMIAHYLIQPELHHNMDYMAEIYLNYHTIHIDELIGPKGKNQKSMRSLLPSQVYEYAAEDADITLRLKNKLEPELKKYELWKKFKGIVKEYQNL